MRRLRVPPWMLDPRVHPHPAGQATAHGYSFPSGHTANATMAFGGMAMHPRAGRGLRALLWLLVLLIAGSRNYLGVHTPWDVAAGILLILAVLHLVRLFLACLEKHPRLDILVPVAGVALNALALVYAATKSYPLDRDAAGRLLADPAKMAIDVYFGCGFSLGVALSWFIDRRWLRYEIRGSAMWRVTACVAGLFGFVVLWQVLLPLLPANLCGKVLYHFLLVVYVMLVVPFILQKLALRDRAPAPAHEKTGAD